MKQQPTHAAHNFSFHDLSVTHVNQADQVISSQESIQSLIPKQTQPEPPQQPTQADELFQVPADQMYRKDLHIKTDDAMSSESSMAPPFSVKNQTIHSHYKHVGMVPALDFAEMGIRPP